MLKRWLFGGAIVAVLALMGYGVYEAAAGDEREPLVEGRQGRAQDGVGLAQGHELGSPAFTSGQGGGGRGQGQGQGQARLAAGVAPVEADLASVTVSGVVDGLDGSELVIVSEAGERLVVGLGQSSYWQSLGVALEPGKAVVVAGYLEDGELKAQTLTVVATGETVVLRDSGGRPMWAGGGRWADPSLGRGQSS